MQKIVIKNPLTIDHNAYKGKVPTAKDYDTLINYECEIYENDKLVCIYKNWCLFSNISIEAIVF